MTVKRMTGLARRQSRTGFMFVLPWIIGFAVFIAIPVLQSLIYSFCNVEIAPNSVILDWNGWGNYSDAFGGEDTADFKEKLVTSVTEMVYQIPIIMVFSLFVALVLNQKFFGRTAARIIFFLPIMVSSGVVLSVMNDATVVSDIMNSGTESTLMQFTQFQDMLVSAGISSGIAEMIIDFVNNIFSIVLKSGIQILLFLAGLQTISPSSYEAAMIEGANSWEMFWKITFPLISPIILLNLVYSVIDNLTAYENTAMQYINELSLDMRLALTSAMSWSYFVIILAMVGICYLLFGRRLARLL